MTSPALASLSEAQVRAATHVDSPVLALAGAGSGKTRMLAGRLAYLVSPPEDGGLGADPSSVMMVTFTKKAAHEMRERITPIMDELRARGNGRDPGRPWIGTFHGLSLGILRIESGKAGLGEGFSIFDEADSEALVTSEVERMNLRSFDRDLFFRDLERAKARLLDAGMLSERQEMVASASSGEIQETEATRRWERILGHFRSERFVEVYAGYQAALREQNAVDFSDLLIRTVNLMKDCSDVRSFWQSSFRHFLVDEVQDINRAQVAWLEAITGGGRETAPPGASDDRVDDARRANVHAFPCPTIAFVGDDDQSIYGFRGSEVKVMLGLAERFPGLEKVTLDTSFRCAPAILNVANALVQRNKVRAGKTLRSPNGVSGPGPVVMRRMPLPADETARLVGEARAWIREGGPPREFAVLLRTREHVQAVAGELRKAGLPVAENRSTDLRRAAEVRDALAFASFHLNPLNETAFRRIANRPARGLGPTSMKAVQDNAWRNDITLLEEFRRVADESGGGEGRYATAFVNSARKFMRMMDGMNEWVAGATNAGEALLGILRRTGYMDSLFFQALRSAGLDIDEHVDMTWDPPLRFLVRLTERAAGNGPESGAGVGIQDLAASAGRLSEAARRIGNVALLLEQAALCSDLDGFVMDALLDAPDLSPAEGLQVMTVHAAKGLEFDHVRLPFLIEGVMPHHQAGTPGEIEEERRLAYVALTRARQTVEISCPVRLTGCPYIRQRRARASRFVGEMQQAGADFERRSWRELTFGFQKVPPRTREVDPCETHVVATDGAVIDEPDMAMEDLF